MPIAVDRESAEYLLPSKYSRPGQLRQEYAVDAMLQLAAVPATVISQIRPPVPMQVYPPRFGYRSDPLTIGEVIATDRWAPTVRSWFSGAPSMGPRIVEQPYAEPSSRNAIAFTGPV